MLVLLGTGDLHGQLADDPVFISTDRPSIANSSVVVPKGDIQAENGMLITNTQGGDYTLDFPETALRFGLLNKTELRLSAPNYFYAVSTAPAGSSGFGDIVVGVKQQLGFLGGYFNASVVFFLSLPTGADAISSHGYDPGLQLPWSHQLPKNWTASGQVALYSPTQNHEHNLTAEATFALNRQLSKPWDVFVEYAGDFPRRGGSRHLVHFGTTYKIARRHQIDSHVAAGISEAAPDIFVGIGYSFLLRVPK